MAPSLASLCAIACPNPGLEAPPVTKHTLPFTNPIHRPFAFIDRRLYQAAHPISDR
jgi:hypothetical protein